MPKTRTQLGAIFTAALALAPLDAALGAGVEDFYGKTDITMIVGFNPGGTYDLYARLAAKHLPRHIPGNPNIIVKNVPGVGSLKAANFLYKQAPRDGATIGVVSQTVALQQVLKHPAVRYNAKEFRFLGRFTQSTEITIVWHTAPVKTLEDAKKRKVVIGATSPRSSTDTNHRLMNVIAGTKFDIVHGYKGTNGILHAIERGEVQGGLSVLQNLVVRKPGWIRDGKIRILVQYTQERHPRLPDVPAMVEFGDTKEDKEVLSLFGGTAAVGRSLMAPPGIPADRLKALRAAFLAMTRDPAVVAEMKSKNMELDPLSGDKLQALIDKTFNISPEAAARAAAARKVPKK